MKEETQLTAAEVSGELRKAANPDIAEHSKRFFKTGKGEYGEGDRFLGIRVPVQRAIAKKYRGMAMDEIRQLLQSVYHEERLTALFILVLTYQKADETGKKALYEFYIANLEFVNNWDLVDSSAKQVAGHYLMNRDRSVLYNLLKSDNIWERRVAVIATHYFIGEGDPDDTFEISRRLLNDPHDLIHKATGWMLREAGKTDQNRLETFLQQHYKNMPRTMLRYAIEKLPEQRRKKYLNGKI